MSFSHRFFLPLFLASFFISAKTFCQQNFVVNGVVFEKGTKNRLALAEISNKRNNYAVGSNDIGLFSIKLLLGDTIVISKRNFNPLVLVVTSANDVVVHLTRDANTLNEVTVFGQTKKQEMTAIQKDFRSKGSFYGGKPPLALLSPFGGSPLTFLYELFGRTPKNARRFNNMYVVEMQQTHVDKFYNKTNVNEQTGLQGKELEDFMINNRPDYETAKNWTSYDGLKWIIGKYKKYSDTAKVIK